MSRVLAPGLVIAAAVVLTVSGGTGGALAAATVGGAILAVWSVGSVGSGEKDPANRQRLGWERLTGVGLALSLGGGVLLAAGLADGPGFFGLPRSLWGLLLGVWLIPLLLTSTGFAASFRPPDSERLQRLRAERRPDA